MTRVDFAKLRWSAQVWLGPVCATANALSSVQDGA